MRSIDADALIKILKADYEDEGLNVEVTEEKGLIYETRKYSYGQSIYLKAIERVKESPIVDVVPKSALEEWRAEAIHYQGLWCQTEIELNEAKQEVAREIFEEIENRAFGFGACFVEMTRTTFDEIKKKYTESEDKP